MLYRRWPHWWDDPLSFTRHARRRMLKRNLDEIQVRILLDSGETLQAQTDGETWQVTAYLENQKWCLIIKPDLIQRRIVLITMYPLSV